MFWISSDSVVMSLFSFLILLILSLCPIVSLAKGLFILFIFSKNQLLVWIILCFHLVDFSPDFDYSLKNLLLFVLELSVVLSRC